MSGKISTPGTNALNGRLVMNNFILFTVLAVLLFACVAVGQEVLTNQGVVEMATAGIPDVVIIAKIRGSKTSFDLSTPALAKLTEAKVSSAIMKAMIELPSSDPAVPTATTAGIDPNDPVAAHDPGIYLMIASRDGGRKMVLIERAGSGRDKTAHVGRAVATMGIAKAQVRAEVPGPRAAVRAGVMPEFYMYFPPTGNLGSADAISSPSQFSLILLEKKKDHRETVVAKEGYGRASAGVDEKKIAKFRTDKLRAYAYKVMPSANLKAGEYAFVAATGMGGTASAAAVAIYDFGIDE